MTGDRPASAAVAPPRKGAPNPFYILATAPHADERTRVLKHGDTFAVFDHYGDITPAGLGEEGIYHEGTRFLSSLLLALGQTRPLFLSSTVKADNDLLVADLTNPDMHQEKLGLIPRGTVHIFRTTFLWQGVCYMRLRLKNYGLSALPLTFFVHFDADYCDIFEVRGMKRPHKGRLLSETDGPATRVLAYEGLDHVLRRTRLKFNPAPTQLGDQDARFDVTLQPQEEATYCFNITCEVSSASPAALSYDQALAAVSNQWQGVCQRICGIRTTNAPFNGWIDRTVADLHMMTTATPDGPYPFAGVPWFSTPFGRDGIITALECLWLNPELTKGVLRFLAATQATEVRPEQDAEPGKILHEMRRGEMAALGEIPFGRYYGSVDATPLFVMLAAAYYQRSGDRSLIESLWSHIDRALQWIDTYGDADRDGFVEYSRQSPKGLVQQGWKDSHDSVFHANGNLAKGPIALCEVQGYVFAARRGAAQLALVLGLTERAERLEVQAQQLQKRFEQAFWCPDLKTYALALDGDKRPCCVRTSNAGHCLFTGIAAAERAEGVAQTLLRPESFSGWGIRTVDRDEVRYNPMSYHNGSIWPHDNALIAAGLARYGLKEGVLQVMTGLYDASVFVDLHRLPELFCGFTRRPGEGPTLYPVACAPQTWSAVTVFFLLQACLGLEVQSLKRTVSFAHPRLPEFLPELRINNLMVGPARIDLHLVRHAQDVGINVERKEGEVEIAVTI
jgi:glycogen debranching enzyme